MVHATYRLICDCCTRTSFADGSDSEEDVRAGAKSHGWTFRAVPNGSVWDLCPDCSKLKTEELP